MRIAIGLLSVFYFAVTSYAQTLSNEGIAGHLDKQHRGPVLTISASASNGAGKILADAHVPYEELNKFPIRFDFYINGELKSSQLRTPELNRAIGIDVPSSMATIPFNYQVVATLLTPNRVYPTVIQGAVFENSLGGVFTCTVNATVNDTQKTYTKREVTIGQTSSTSFDLSFVAETAEGDDFEVSGAVLTGDGSTLSGNLVTTADGTSSTRAVSGTYTKENDTLSNLSVSAEGLEITCE